MIRTLLDVDGVLADWLTPALAVVREETGVSYTYESFDSWHLDETFRRDGLDDKKVFAAIYRRVDIRELHLLPGAVEAVERLRALGDVYFVSAVQDVRARGAWLEEHFGHAGVTRKHLVATHAKYLIAGSVLVDDYAPHVEVWARAHPEGQGCLFAQPYNRLEERERYDWAGVLGIARRLAAFKESVR